MPKTLNVTTVSVTLAPPRGGDWGDEQYDAALTALSDLDLTYEVHKLVDRLVKSRPATRDLQVVVRDSAGG